MSRSVAGFLIALLALAAACSGGAQPLVLVASSPGSLEVGSQRILLALVDAETQAFLPSPEMEATATFSGPEGETVDGVALEFTWAIPDERGLYRADVELPTAGEWTVSVAAEGLPATEPMPFFVDEDTEMPQIGEPAPVVASRTVADHDLSEITSDPAPDPDLYRLSLDDALTDERPTVVVFATPAFCTSETCGPVLDNVKSVAERHPDVDFVHVEIYENLDADTFEELIPVEAVEAWALPSEPWVFVTDSGGLVTARFEGAVDPIELEQALLSGAT